MPVFLVELSTCDGKYQGEGKRVRSFNGCTRIYTIFAHRHEFAMKISLISSLAIVAHDAIDFTWAQHGCAR